MVCAVFEHKQVHVGQQWLNLGIAEQSSKIIGANIHHISLQTAQVVTGKTRLATACFPGTDSIDEVTCFADWDNHRLAIIFNDFRLLRDLTKMQISPFFLNAQ